MRKITMLDMETLECKLGLSWVSTTDKENLVLDRVVLDWVSYTINKENVGPHVRVHYDKRYHDFHNIQFTQKDTEHVSELEQITAAIRFAVYVYNESLKRHLMLVNAMNVAVSEINTSIDRVFGNDEDGENA